MSHDIFSLIGDQSEYLLGFHTPKIDASKLHLPGKDFVDRVLLYSDRSAAVQRNYQTFLNAGRLSGTGYCSILPIDQGIEHTAGYSFAQNPSYFDPEHIVALAIEGGCNAVSSTVGVLGMVAKKYAHRIPFIVKINHNELLTYPNKYDQVLFGSVEQAFQMGAVAVGATVYWGSEHSSRQLQEISQAFEHAHELGLFTILWCYTRNDAFATPHNDYHTATDLTGQANHLGVTIQADIIKQKMPTTNFGFRDLQFGKHSPEMYEQLTSEHPIDMTRYQLINCYMGRAGLINSGGESSGYDDLREAVLTAVINKRAGGMGLISGRKIFKRPLHEGVEILHAIQDVYLDDRITVA